MRKRLIVGTLIAGLVALSGVAAAADDGDTVFNFGYDEENDVLLWNHNPNDGVYDCTLENGTLTATYSLTEDGLVNVDVLTDGTDPVEFDPIPEEELAEGLESVDEPFVYAGADADCGVSGGTVAGPNGQINHGMFMKLFNSLFDGQKRGCLNRHLAKSSLGKDSQQLRVGDVEADAEALADQDTGMVTFETVLADCRKDDKVTGQEKKAEKADRQRGKSAEAPGHNK